MSGCAPNFRTARLCSRARAHTHTHTHTLGRTLNLTTDWSVKLAPPAGAVRPRRQTTRTGRTCNSSPDMRRFASCIAMNRLVDHGTGTFRTHLVLPGLRRFAYLVHRTAGRANVCNDGYITLTGHVSFTRAFKNICGPHKHQICGGNMVQNCLKPTTPSRSSGVRTWCHSVTKPNGNR